MLGYVVSLIIGLVIGVSLAWKVEKQPLIIKAKPEAKDWGFIIVFEFILTFLFVSAEIIISVYLDNTIQSDNEFENLAKVFLGNGVLTVAFNALIVWFFFRMIRQYYLDLSGAYSVTLFKCVYSVITLIICFDLYCIFRDENVEKNPVIPHIVAWLVTIAGMWINIDAICCGRIKEEMQNREISRSVVNNRFRRKQLIVICSVLALLVAYSFLCIQGRFKYIIDYISVYTLLLLLSMSISLIVYLRCKRPSERCSNRKLSRVIAKLNNIKEDLRIENISYIGEHYDLVKTSDMFVLSVHKRDVKCEMIEAPKLFGEKNINYERLDYDAIRNELKKIVKERNDFIKQAFDSCRSSLDERKYDNQ